MRLLTLWGLFGIGMIQPILDLYGRNPEVFIAARAGAGRIVAFVLVVTIAPVAVCAVVLLVARRLGAGEVAYRVLLFVGAFVAASAVLEQVLPDSDLNTVWAAALAAGIVWLEGRFAYARTGLRILSLTAVAAPVLFLGLSEASSVVWESEARVETSIEFLGRTPVVMVVFDELPLSSLLDRSGEVNADLFPNFARVAAASHWFKNAQSNSIATADSIPILVTGRISEGAHPTSQDHPVSVYTLLGGSYEMDVHESVTSVCPTAICDGAGSHVSASSGVLSLLGDAAVVWGHLTQPEWITSRLPAIDAQWGGFLGGADGNDETADRSALPLAPAGERLGWVDEMLAAAERLQSAGTDTFHYLHVTAPHAPWRTNPSGTQYFAPEALTSAVLGVENQFWIDDPAPVVQGFQRHLYQLGLVDLLLGRILDAMERAGTWDDSIIVVTADHGASFAPGDNRRWVTPTNLDALYRVPLFIRIPGQTAGAVHVENAYGLDVLPTILDLLDIDPRPEWGLQGRSLFDPELPSTRNHLYDHYRDHRQALGGVIDPLFDEVSHTYTLVSDRTSWTAIAAAGPYADLVGEPVVSLEASPLRGAVAEFDHGELLADLNPGDGFVPTVLTGRISVPEGVDAGDLLVAVNGTVAGAGFAVTSAGNTSMFTAFVPEEAYVPGANTVALLVRAPNGGWIAAGDGNVAVPVLRDASGVELDPLPATRSVSLVVETAAMRNDQLVVRGWSADTVDVEPPTEILIFLGDRLVHAGPPTERRQDVLNRFDDETVAVSGFRVVIPLEEVPAGTEQVTVVARFADDIVVQNRTIEH